MKTKGYYRKMKDYHKKFNDNDFEKLMDSIDRVTKSFRKMNGGEELTIYTNEDMCKKLGVSETLLSRYRDERQLPYSKVGDKYFYTDEDIESFIENTSSKRLIV